MAKRKNFKQLWIHFTESSIRLERHTNFINKQIVVHPIDLQKKKQLEKQVQYYEKELKNFGSGKIIRISGKYWDSPKNNSDLSKELDFELLLINTELEEAKDYFQVYMDNSNLKFNKATIEFQEIITNKLINR